MRERKEEEEEEEVEDEVVEEEEEDEEGEEEGEEGGGVREVEVPSAAGEGDEVEVVDVVEGDDAAAASAVMLPSSFPSISGFSSGSDNP